MEPVHQLGLVSIARPDTAEDPVSTNFGLLPLRSAPPAPEKISVVTPCFPSSAAASYAGVDELWLKDETKQPTGSTKDRMAAVAVGVMIDQGVGTFVAASTGNSSTSLARAVEIYGGIRGHFFAGRKFAPNHRFESNENVELHIVNADFVEASRRARAFAIENGYRPEAGFASWARREGLKIAYIEAVQQMGDEPDAVAQAVSSGMGMIGAYKGFDELKALGSMSKLPKALIIQQETCAPMVAGWRRGATQLGDPDVIRDPQGPATAILRGDGRQSYPYLRSIALRSQGGIFSAPLSEMTLARRVLKESEGIDACYASAAALAGVKMARQAGVVARDDRVLVNVTGAIRAV